MFGRKKKEAINLPEDVKLKIEVGKDLLNETKKRAKEKGFELTLTYKMQLDDDIRFLNRAMEKVEKGHFGEKETQQLEKAIQCLKTTSENILEWKWENASSLSKCDTISDDRKEEAGKKEKKNEEDNLWKDSSSKESSLNHTGSVNMITERLKIRRFERKDLEDLYNNYGSDPLVRVYVTFSPCMTEEGCKGFLEMHLGKYESDDTFYGWGIEYQGQIIGSIGAFDVDEDMKSVELGYSIGSRYWNKGIVSEAADAVIHHLIETVGFHRVFASCHEENKGSMGVMEKIGMTYEGRARKATKGSDGKYADLVYYSILDSDSSSADR